jgi:serine acetyltransferase
VVVKDVPAGVIVVGVPGVVREHRAAPPTEDDHFVDPAIWI